ncbi:ultraviolet-B receptor UVR8 [Impatiens glandulifera]|uniref:ultraviolet-B receptor UVR8 n=1 Tax=Impatiens glandulifera TaxID=253017 RepID=UPI001FB12E5C|nr:ultraviolet-B receptor UVR8 [Impatiens glandulifera]
MAVAGISTGSRSLSHKIVSVAAGEAHTLVLSADGSVYAWGKGRLGRLGTGSENDEPFPVRVGSDSNLRFVEVAAGAYHSLALADDGSVWSWGYNIYGQLGIDGENAGKPRLVERFLELRSSSLTEDEHGRRKPLKVSFIKAGGMMSLAIDDLGGLWIWGNCPQQGGSNEESFSLVKSSVPIPVWNFHGHTVVKVACGNEHIVALVSAGESYKADDLVCYSWGNNNHGQLGLGDRESRSRPEIIQNFNEDSSWVVYQVACGAFHTVLLGLDKRLGDTLGSICWTFGLGDNGQLGHGSSRSANLPEPVQGLPEETFLVSVDCGLFHTSVVSSSGDVWSWGMEKGLGLCPDSTDMGDAVGPRLITNVNGSTFPDPVQVACGAAHTVLVGEGGFQVWSWGRGRNGVLGTGRTIDAFVPTSVLWPPFAGGQPVIENERRRIEKSPVIENERRTEKSPEMDRTLATVLEEREVLRSKLSIMGRYASLLHGSIFGKPFEEKDIPESLLHSSGTFDVAKEWENMLESSDVGRLHRLEMFYRNMVEGVKDKRMKKRVEEIVKECIAGSRTGRQ